MPFALQPITESFFGEAPMRYTIDVEVPAAPDYVWSEFTRQDTLDWCLALKQVTYTSPAPYGPKTTRTAVLAPGLVTINEQFFLWEEDAQAHRYRHAFYGKVCSVPGLKNFGEYTEVTPAGTAAASSGSSRCGPVASRCRPSSRRRSRPRRSGRSRPTPSSTSADPGRLVHVGMRKELPALSSSR